MEAYDDRPISMYDNLNMSGSMHTSTPKQKPQPQQQTAALTVRSPYNDISFQFDDNKHKIQQQQQLLPNGNNTNTLMTTNQQQQLQQQLKQVQLNTPQYATPFKPTTTAPTTTNTTLGSASHATRAPLLTQTTPQQQLHNYTHAPIATTTTTIPATTTAATTPATAYNAFTAQRPLSQHSQSELNESIQSIAAVKAALSDAKSKFFGLNGYAQDNYSNNNNNTQEHQQIPANFYESQSLKQQQQQQQPVQQEANHNKVQNSTIQSPQPPPKPQHQPKYQNIPENSAIYRQQPPVLPPKPSHLNALSQQNAAAASAAASLATPSSSNNQNQNTNPTTMPSTSAAAAAATVTINEPDYGASTSSTKLLPHAAYKQLPLNDTIDSAQHPSQAVYMTTTVPQNIKGSKIAGRHTPTRNSLRHSRMLVVNNKNYQGHDVPNPLNLKHPKFTRWLLFLQMLIGLALLCLAIWTFFLAPTTQIQDNPYWSGLALVLASIIGLIIIRFQRIKRHKLRDTCFKFLRADTYIVALLAAMLCCLCFACAAIHFMRLTASDTQCAPTNILLQHGSCSCTFNVPPNAAKNGTELDIDSIDNFVHEEPMEPDAFEDQSYKVEYRDLSCMEVRNEWIPILSLSMILNALGLTVSLLYICMVMCHRSNRFYSTVQTSTF